MKKRLFLSYTKAIEEAKKDNQKQDSFLYFQPAGAKYESGDKKGAITDYDQAIKINPNLSQAYKNRTYLNSK